MLRLDNKTARRLWLNTQCLASSPIGPLNVPKIIRNLGFVQLDTIRNVTRAHHHIIWSRNQNYREPLLNKLLAEERAIFEHFTHDASVLPIEFYPMWTKQFRRMREKVNRADFYRSPLNQKEITAIRRRIEREGPLSTQSFNSKIDGPKEIWARPPHKRALDHMWYTGELATSHRENFTKFYDLAERVIPREHHMQKHSDAVQIDWLCVEALGRLGFGSPGEIQRFWDVLSAQEVKAWVEENASQLVQVEVETADKSWFKAFAPQDIEMRIAAVGTPTSRLRIINPFDPAIRNRNRLARLFGFDYRIEIFVPASKRVWGYYVYPLLEGDRFVGRIELKANRKRGEVRVIQFWSERNIKWSEKRSEKLDAELYRLGKLVGAQEIRWECPRLPALSP